VFGEQREETVRGLEENDPDKNHGETGTGSTKGGEKGDPAKEIK